MNDVFEPLHEFIRERGWKGFLFEVLITAGWVGCVIVVALWMWVIQ
jgi:hypothetical protein